MRQTGVLNCLLLFFITSSSCFSISDRDDYFGLEENGKCGYSVSAISIIFKIKKKACTYVLTCIKRIWQAVYLPLGQSLG